MKAPFVVMSWWEVSVSLASINNSTVENHANGCTSSLVMINCALLTVETVSYSYIEKIKPVNNGGDFLWPKALSSIGGNINAKT